jgi:hypothetical protein
MLTGRVPGGRPPAWESGEAMPWPKPGEEAATALGGEGDEPEPEPDETPQLDSGERRKRKQRD